MPRQSVVVRAFTRSIGRERDCHSSRRRRSPFLSPPPLPLHGRASHTARPASITHITTVFRPVTMGHTTRIVRVRSSQNLKYPKRLFLDISVKSRCIFKLFIQHLKALSKPVKMGYCDQRSIDICKSYEVKSIQKLVLHVF